MNKTNARKGTETTVKKDKQTPERENESMEWRDGRKEGQREGEKGRKRERDRREEAKEQEREIERDR